MDATAADLPPIRVRVKFLDTPGDPYGAAGREHSLVYATAGSAGLDLRACLDQEVATIPPGERMAVPAGVAIEVLEPGVAGFVFSRSGLGAKEGLTVAQGVGVIDPDYRGQIMVWLLNTSGERLRVARGQRIAQLIFMPFFRADLQAVEDLGETDRGAGGFGHTGR